jgi:hypothetical protein
LPGRYIQNQVYNPHEIKRSLLSRQVLHTPKSKELVSTKMTLNNYNGLTYPWEHVHNMLITLSWSSKKVMLCARSSLWTLGGHNKPGITTLSQVLSWVLMNYVLNLCHNLAPIYSSIRAPYNSLMLLNQEENPLGYILKGSMKKWLRWRNWSSQ